MTRIRTGSCAALLAGSILALGLFTGGAAEAQSSWLKPAKEDPSRLNQEQTALFKKVVQLAGEAMSYGGAFECHVSKDGKCTGDWPDLNTQAEAEKFAGIAKSCADTAKAAVAAGLANDARINFDGPGNQLRASQFQRPLALRSVLHACTYYRVLADRHLARVKAKDIDWGGDSKIHSAAAEFADIVNRVIAWETAVTCHETKSTHSRCEREPKMTEARNAERWKKETDVCVSDFRKAVEVKTPGEYPIGFRNAHPTFVSPEPIATLGKYCEDMKVRADKLYQEIVAGPQAAAAKAKEDEFAKKEAARLAEIHKEQIGGLAQHNAEVIGVGLRLAEGDTKLEAELIGRMAAPNEGPIALENAVHHWWENQVQYRFLNHAERCVKQGGHILKEGASPDLPVDARVQAIDWKSEFKLPLTLGQYVKACEKIVAYVPELRKKVEAHAKTAQAERGKAEQAKLAMFLGVLQGDRARIFKENLMHKNQTFGPGGTLLKTPEDFVKAKAWYWYAIDHQARPAAQWKSEGWQFAGDKLLRKFGDADFGQSIPWTRAMPEPKDGAPGTMGKGGAAPAPQQRGSNDAAPATSVASTGGTGGTGGGSTGGGSASGGSGSGGGDAGGGDTVGYAAGGGGGSIFGLLFLALLGAGFLAVYRFLNLRLKAVEDVLDQLPDARRLMARIPAKAQGPILSGKT
ncbi:MAG: hypothetical protein KIT20_08640 [Alphaproteobacteria bacterium]|nr:hypothetical protein [Alphaproteobacteria bacterium]